MWRTPFTGTDLRLPWGTTNLCRQSGDVLHVPRPWRCNPVSSWSSNLDIVNDSDDEAHSAPKCRDASDSVAGCCNPRAFPGPRNRQARREPSGGLTGPPRRLLVPRSPYAGAACCMPLCMAEACAFYIVSSAWGSSMAVLGTSLADGLERRCRCHQPTALFRPGSLP